MLLAIASSGSDIFFSFIHCVFVACFVKINFETIIRCCFNTSYLQEMAEFEKKDKVTGAEIRTCGVARKQT